MTAALPSVTLTRSFEAPRALVFRAWTEPSMIAQWWGPHGFTSTVRPIVTGMRKTLVSPSTVMGGVSRSQSNGGVSPRKTTCPRDAG